MTDKKFTEKNKFVGAYVPYDFADYITLYSLFIKTNKSKILREALQKWKEQKPVTQESMIDSVVESLQSDWNEFKYAIDKSKKDIEAFFDTYKEGYKEKLINEGLTPGTANDIIKKIKK